MKTMTTTLTAIVLAATSTSAFAFTCENTVENVEGVLTYTSSVCTGQSPATQATLEVMTKIEGLSDEE